MAGVFEIFSIAAAAFVATNIDDLFILMIFFSKRSFPTTQIIVGQYIGMSLLIGVSLVGSLIILVIPHNLIGLIGLFPIVIGIKELIDLLKQEEDNSSSDDYDEAVTKRLFRTKWRAYFPFLVVTTITFSGGEEIGIFTSIFATYNSLPEIITIVSTVMMLTGVWCITAAYLINHALVATRFRRLADKVLPFVLMALGIYILAEAYIVPAVAKEVLFQNTFSTSFQFWHQL